MPEPDHDSIGPHMAYAVQWWLFAAGVPVGWFILVRRERRDRSAAAASPADSAAEATGDGADNAAAEGADKVAASAADTTPAESAPAEPLPRTVAGSE